MSDSFITPRNLKLVGRIHSTQGLRGEVFVIFSADPEHWLDDAELLYAARTEESKPHRVLEIVRYRPHSKQGFEGFAILFKDVNDKNASDLLAKNWLFADADLFVSEAGENVFLSELQDFMVIDKVRGEVGPIVDFSSNGVQDLIVVQRGAETYEVPLVKNFIEKVDFENQKIYMDIPEGLLEDL